MKDCKILCVCGSGTVSSSMVANKLKDKLADRGYNMTAVEASPNNVATTLAQGGFDVIACVSPVHEDYPVPKVNAVGMMTGMNEEKVLDDIIAVLEGGSPAPAAAAPAPAPAKEEPKKEEKPKKKFFWQR